MSITVNHSTHFRDTFCRGLLGLYASAEEIFDRHLAESLKRGGDIRRGKYERGLSGMQLEVLPKTHGRFGAALPTMQLYRDLEIGLVDGGQNLAVTSVLPVAQAARPETVFEAAGAQVVQLNDTSAATLPVFDGDVTDTTWISENAPAPSSQP